MKGEICAMYLAFCLKRGSRSATVRQFRAMAVSVSNRPEFQLAVAPNGWKHSISRSTNFKLTLVRNRSWAWYVIQAGSIELPPVRMM